MRNGQFLNKLFAYQNFSESIKIIIIMLLKGEI